MSLSSVLANYLGQIQFIGKAGLNAVFPNEFELYLVAFELVDNSSGGPQTEEYFIFPVMPNSIRRPEIYLNTVRKTLGGVYSVSNPTFNPIDFSISGNFGRSFKILVGKNTASNLTSFVSADYQKIKAFVNQSPSGSGNSNDSPSKPEFDTSIKTGYACCKILQRIFDKAKTTVNGVPKQLFFYNLSFGESYLVKGQVVEFFQNKDVSNMIWNYDIRMKAVLPLDNLLNSQATSNSTLSANQVLNKTINNLANKISTVNI